PTHTHLSGEPTSAVPPPEPAIRLFKKRKGTKGQWNKGNGLQGQGTKKMVFIAKISLPITL
ncbi:hypothetical protein, partial [uncultured Duncaniella sp.]